GELDQEQLVLHQVVAEGRLRQAAVAQAADERVVDVIVPVGGNGGLEAFEQRHRRALLGEGGQIIGNRPLPRGSAWRAPRRRSGDNRRMDAICNIAAALPRLAAADPDRIAMRYPGRDGRYANALTYGELDHRSNAIAAGLATRGIVRGSRTVVMVRPTPEFFLLMFALFKAGAVPVLVDPGINKRALRQCLDEAEPQAFIGIPLAMFARALLGWAKAAR